MSFLLQAAWVTQASDFLTQNWDKLLGILGGASGIVAVLMFIGKIILVCVQGKMSRKNNLPLQVSFVEFKNEVNATISKINEALNNGMAEMKEDLKSYLQSLLEKSQKMKIALYDKLVTEGENAQELLEELNSKIEEVQSVIEPDSNVVELVNTGENTIDEQVAEQCNVEAEEQKNEVEEPTKKQKKKVKKVVVER